jgi:outer membrane lipoprotein-sorting protein
MKRSQIIPVLIAMSAVVQTALGQPVASGDWGLPQLMIQMQQVRRSAARFVETKDLRLLNKSLQSSGKLIYIAPDNLQKFTLWPEPSSLVVSGNRLTIAQFDGDSRSLALSDYPQVGALVESVRATLAGDLPRLERYYAVSLAGNEMDWILQLAPHSSELGKLVKRIEVRGAGHDINSIETEESDGDRTRMTITPDPG